MLKTGRFRAFRNIPTGWLLQAIHSTDRSERYFRLLMEFMTLAFVYWVFMELVNGKPIIILCVAFVINHTITWFITGNFWVYMLDSFLWVKNPGIDGVIKYIQLTKSIFVATHSVDAILIYGSMCRGQLHIRSDLDLRVLRSPGIKNAVVSLSVGYLLRVYSFFIRMPVDIQVIDSMEFIRQQMRADEHPINVYLRKGVIIPEIGMDFSDVEANPEIVLKDNV